MKLVLATPLYPPEAGGPSTYAQTLVDGLPARGMEVVLVKFGDVRHLPKIIRHVVFFWHVWRALREADLVLALDPVSVGLPACIAARIAGKPFFVKIVGDYAWEQGSQRYDVTHTLDEFVQTRQTSFFVRLLQWIQTRVARSATRVIVPSKYLKGIVSAWGVSTAKIEVIYNGIALPDVVVEPKARPQGFLVVSSGRRVPWKGFEAIERVVVREPSWHFFLAHGLPRTEALGWVKAADVFVLNSSYEGLPHAILEAMMLGTPVIATRIGGNPELIEDGKTGLLIPLGDEEALHSALKQVEHNPAAARTRAEAGKLRVQNFSVPTMLAKTAAVLKNL